MSFSHTSLLAWLLDLYHLLLAKMRKIRPRHACSKDHALLTCDIWCVNDRHNGYTHRCIPSSKRWASKWYVGKVKQSSLHASDASCLGWPSQSFQPRPCDLKQPTSFWTSIRVFSVMQHGHRRSSCQSVIVMACHRPVPHRHRCLYLTFVLSLGLLKRQPPRDAETQSDAQLRHPIMVYVKQAIHMQTCDCLRPLT